MSSVNAGLQSLTNQGLTPVIRGMAWHQGESDVSEAQGTDYGANLRGLILDVHAEFDAPDMQFVYGSINQYSNNNE